MELISKKFLIKINKYMVIAKSAVSKNADEIPSDYKRGKRRKVKDGDANTTSRMTDLKNLILKQKFTIGALVVGVIVLIAVFSGSDGKAATSSKTSPSASVNPASTVQVNKTFTFNAINAQKKAVPVTLTIGSVELKKEIKVQDETKTSGQGKQFLLMRIEIENSLTEKLAITTADLIRLTAGTKKFAPDYHNATVVLDPLSIRKDLIAFIVSNNDKEFTFQIGELAGDKEPVTVKFQ